MFTFKLFINSQFCVRTIVCTEQFARWMVNHGRIAGGIYRLPPFVLYL